MLPTKILPSATTGKLISPCRQISQQQSKRIEHLSRVYHLVHDAKRLLRFLRLKHRLDSSVAAAKKIIRSRRQRKRQNASIRQTQASYCLMCLLDLMQISAQELHNARLREDGKQIAVRVNDRNTGNAVLQHDLDGAHQRSVLINWQVRMRMLRFAGHHLHAGVLELGISESIDKRFLVGVQLNGCEFMLDMSKEVEIVCEGLADVCSRSLPMNPTYLCFGGE
jgi:hypothetical protein